METQCNEQLFNFQAQNRRRCELEKYFQYASQQKYRTIFKCEVIQRPRPCKKADFFL